MVEAMGGRRRRVRVEQIFRDLDDPVVLDDAVTGVGAIWKRHHLMAAASVEDEGVAPFAAATDSSTRSSLTMSRADVDDLLDSRAA